MKKIAAIFLAAVMCIVPGCGKDKKEAEDKADMPKNIISYKDKENSELIPDGKTVEVGQVIEAEEPELPSEEELGEYEEIFMEGDVVDETSCAGWVISVSLKDITVNTYNKLTKYLLSEEAANTASHLKPGDAVFVHYTTDEETGEKTAYELGRVRVEDEPLTKDEIQEMYGGANEQ
ncbi:MAG: hypothetical protein ACI4SS_07100 [Clostridia bacterium]